MARQFRGRLTREALRERLAAQAAHPAAAQVADDAGDPQPGTDLEQVVDWMTRLHLLQGIPFNYLVPDARMLPQESIRFFQVDGNWIEALLDGAYSVGFAGVSAGIGDVLRGPVKRAAAARAHGGVHRRALLARAAPLGTPAIAIDRMAAEDDTPTPEVLTGFLLRSAAVSGWPGLEVHAFSDTAGTEPLQLVRMELLAPALLLVLVAGVMQRVDLQEPAEAVHFGVDPAGKAWQKQLRYANGNDTVTVGSYIEGAEVPVPLRANVAPSILSLATLAVSMSGQVWTDPPPSDTSFTAAQFALEMVEGVQAVSFRLQPS